MNDEAFDSLFSSLTERRGAPYLEAREALLRLGDEDRRRALDRLAAIRASEQPWYVRLTAEILEGWLAHRTEYEQCGTLVRGQPVPEQVPMGGFSPPEWARCMVALGPDVVPRLLEMAGKSFEYVDDQGWQAVHLALERFRDPRALLPMLALAGRGGGAEQRIGAIRVLASLAAPEAFPAVLAIARDDDDAPSVRVAALRALPRFGQAAATTPSLLDALAPSSPIEVRRAAADALFHLDDPQSRPQVLERIPDADLQVTLALVDTLSGIGSPEDLPTLQALADGPDRRVAEVARGALRSIQRRHALGDFAR